MFPLPIAQPGQEKHESISLSQLQGEAEVSLGALQAHRQITSKSDFLISMKLYVYFLQGLEYCTQQKYVSRIASYDILVTEHIFHVRKVGKLAAKDPMNSANARFYSRKLGKLWTDIGKVIQKDCEWVKNEDVDGRVTMFWLREFGQTGSISYEEFWTQFAVHMRSIYGYYVEDSLNVKAAINSVLALGTDDDEVTLNYVSRVHSNFGRFRHILDRATAVCDISGTLQPWFIPRKWSSVPHDIVEKKGAQFNVFLSDKDGFFVVRDEIRKETLTVQQSKNGYSSAKSEHAPTITNFLIEILEEEKYDIPHCLSEWKSLLESLSEENQVNPICIACRDGKIEAVRELLKDTNNIDIQDHDGFSPLMLAARSGHLEVVKILLSRDPCPDLNLLDNDVCYSALYHAVKNGHADVVETLVSNYPSPLLDFGDGMNALTLAKDGQHSEILEYLIREFHFDQPKFIEASFLSNITALSSGAFGVTLKADLWVPTKSDQYVLSVPCVCKISKFEAGTDEIYELQVLNNVPWHPNVLGLLAMCLDFPQDGKKMFATIVPFKAGGSLLDYVKKHRHVSAEMLPSLALDITRGISHLHEHGYLHRDVALRNCFLQLSEISALDSPDARRAVLHRQRAVVGDFGMSRPIGMKIPKEARIPWRWSAPETLESLSAFPESDVWMIGICIWELLGVPILPFGDRIHQGVHLLKFLKSQSDSLIPLLFPEQCPTFYKTLIDKCCQFEVSKRISLAQLRDELETFRGNAANGQNEPNQELSENLDLDLKEENYDYIPADISNKYTRMSNPDQYMEYGSLLESADYVGVDESYIDEASLQGPQGPHGPQSSQVLSGNREENYIGVAGRSEQSFYGIYAAGTQKLQKLVKEMRSVLVGKPDVFSPVELALMADTEVYEKFKDIVNKEKNENGCDLSNIDVETLLKMYYS